jgi:glycosyltransferase involved in cell wall biosynthesis
MSAVSVIMPVYNGSRFISEAIESLLKQSRKDWELIVIDDGSTDSTFDCVSAFQDPRIRAIRQGNQGEGSARNAGLDAARGEYVAFLDADDTYLPNALADLADYLVCHADHDVVYSDGYLCNSRMEPIMRLTEIRSGIYTGNILEHVILASDIVTVPVCTMLRRSVISKAHIRFDTDLDIGTDWRFWIEMARHAKFGYLCQTTCKYRVHNDNMTSRISVRKRKLSLARLHLKIMRAEWFAEISGRTRYHFLSRLLVDFLSHDTAGQHAVLISDNVQKLPPRDRANLWRQVGSQYLLERSERDFALNCLHEACSTFPSDLRSRYLFKIASTAGPAVTSMLVRVWHASTRSAKRVRFMFKRRPRAVPEALLPIKT